MRGSMAGFAGYGRLLGGGPVTTQLIRIWTSCRLAPVGQLDLFPSQTIVTGSSETQLTLHCFPLSHIRDFFWIYSNSLLEVQ